MKTIIFINIFFAVFCFQTKAQSLPDLSINGENINHLIAINLNKQIFLPSVNTSFFISHIICRPGSCKILPLQLLEFKGKAIGSVNHLSWKTVNEILVKQFEIQRSPDAISFKPIGTLNSINLSGTNNYVFDDGFPLAGKNYYRLRMIDMDANFTYSNVIVTHITDAADLINSVKNQVELDAARFGWTYIYQLGNGATDTPIKFGWDIISNTEWTGF